MDAVTSPDTPAQDPTQGPRPGARARVGASGRPHLSIVSACYDEQEVIAAFCSAVRRQLDALPEFSGELLLVDDGSQDDTLEILNGIAAEDPRVRVYSLSRNFGHQVALSAGLDVADADALVMMDSDLQHPPELIPRMVEVWQQGADVVSAVRNETQGAGAAKTLSSRAFYWLLNRLSGTPIPASAADFCLLSRRAHHALRSMPERHRFLRGLVSWVGFERVLLPYQAPERAGGKPKYGLRKMLALALDALFSFSAAPLRLATRLGLIVVLAGALYLVGIVVRALWLDDLVPGWGSLISIALILGGAQLAFIGLLGEYVSRIFEEVKGRPLYFFKQTPDDVIAGRGRLPEAAASQRERG